MRVLLHGCNGRMGRVFTKAAGEATDLQVVCGVDVSVPAHKTDYPVYTSLEDVTEAVDVLVDFSHHSCLDSILAFGLRTKTPLVICTTGFSQAQKQSMAVSSKDVAILNSANMSLGVNLLLSLVKQAASLLHPDFDIEILEKHHNQKIDAPSGTAMMIADAMNSVLEGEMEYVHDRHSRTDKRQKNEIGIHAVRGGAIVGEHTVIFAGQGEIVEVSHTALSRDVFAYGAVSAARFMAGKTSGLFSMKDVIEG